MTTTFASIAKQQLSKYHKYLIEIRALWNLQAMKFQYHHESKQQQQKN